MIPEPLTVGTVVTVGDAYYRRTGPGVSPARQWRSENPDRWQGLHFSWSQIVPNGTDLDVRVVGLAP